MSKQQLYINDVAVDMPAEEIKLKVESNIFSDASKIKTAHSYNIALPRTMTNDAVLGLAYVPSAETGGKTTHKYLKASLHMDGVPLFTDGKAVVTSVEEKGYNLTLLWGLVAIFDEIKREGLNLCDLPLSSHWDDATMSPLTEWLQLPQYDAQVPQYHSGMTSEIYNTLDDESKTLANSKPWILPSVAATTILNKIRQVYRVNFRFSTEAGIRLSRIWHPLVTLKSLVKDEVVRIRYGQMTFPYNTAPCTLQDFAIDTLPNGMLDFKSFDVITTEGAPRATSVPLASNALKTANTTAHAFLAKNKIHARKVKIYGKCDMQWGVEVKDYYTAEGGRLAELNPATNLYELDITLGSVSYEADERIANIFAYTANVGRKWNSLPHTLAIYVELEIDDIDFTLGSWWLPCRNYPEVGVIDYFSELMAHIGGCIVGSVTKPDSIYISTFDEVMQAQPQSCELLGVKTITMTLAELAQKNTYTHKVNEDDGGEYYAEGVIYTADETLALEHTAFDSKFKVPVKGIVRLWEIEDSSTANKKKASWVAKGDYIASNQDGYIYDFLEDFESAIAEYYTNYEKLVAVPKVVEVIIQLYIVDLLNINLGQPVYIKQLGRTYLVKTLESESNDTYKLTLVQM